MQEKNGSQGPSTEHSPDFNQELGRAQQTGDFNFVMQTARNSHKMLVDLKDAILRASFPGRDCVPVAMGLNFISNMIGQASVQLQMLKQTEKETRNALKANGSPTEVVGPEKPDTPEEPPTTPPEPPVPEIPTGEPGAA